MQKRRGAGSGERKDEGTEGRTRRREVKVVEEGGWMEGRFVVPSVGDVCVSSLPRGKEAAAPNGSG